MSHDLTAREAMEQADQANPHRPTRDTIIDTVVPIVLITILATAALAELLFFINGSDLFAHLLPLPHPTTATPTATPSH